MKPFSSLLLFSQPRASDQIPSIEDPVGSFVDVEQLVVLRLAERREEPPPTAHRTLYLFLAEGVDEMLAVRSGCRRIGPNAACRAASLRDVGATMASWLGVPSPDPGGRAIDALLG